MDFYFFLLFSLTEEAPTSIALSLRYVERLVVCRRWGGEGVVRGVVARRVVERRRSVHGRIRTGSLQMTGS